jgi:RecB family exonuclease
MALTKEKTPCEFTDPNRWVRGIADLLIVDGDYAFIIDYKTGSNKYPDPKQLRLMSLMTFAHFPQVQKIKAGLLFVMHNTFIPEQYERKDMEDSWNKFSQSLARLSSSYDNNSWLANPTPLCKYCPVKSCEFHRG